MLYFKKSLGLSVFLILFLIIGLFSLLPLISQAVDISAGDLIKSTSSSAVYYYGSDGNRYCFPNENTYKTWYADFSSVKTISDAELAAIPLKGNVTYKPGIKMVKIQTDPKVYVVDKEATLRGIVSEGVAVALYGSNWNTKIDDISVAFFINYKVGSDVNSDSEFDKSVAEAGASSIDVDKGLTAAPLEELTDTLPGAPVINDPGTSVNTGTTITISWSVPSGADSYNLQRDTTSAFTNPVTIYSGISNSTTDSPSPLMPTTYYYRVKANNSAGASSWSNVVSIEITVLGAPNAPTLNDPGTSVNSGTVFNVSWNTVSGITIYVLERDSNFSFNNPTEIYSGLQTSFSQTLSPTSNATYYYRVQARNNIGYSAWSNVVNMDVTTVSAPSAPTLTDPGNSVATGAHFNLVWSSVTGATAYTLEIASNSNFTSVLATHNLGNVTTYDCWHGVEGTFYYRVKASNAVGSSPWSNSVDMIVKTPTYNVPSEYATIQAAIDAASSGDTVLVAVGTYNENLTMKDGVILKSVAGPTNTIINGVSNVPGVTTITCQNVSSSTTIEGFTIKAMSSNGMAKAIQVGSGASPQIKNNIIIAGSWQAYAILTYGTPTIINNTIIATDNANATCAVCSSGGDPIVINNIMVGDNSRESTAIDVGNNAYPTVHKYNYMYNFKLGINASYDDPSTSRPLGTGEVLTYTLPGFVNSATGDYHLQSSSPCVDAGDPTSSYSSEPSPNGSRINLGAYGNTSEAATTPVVQTRSVPSQYSTVQAAINVANTGDTIQVAAGTYNEKLTLKSGITIQGAGAGSTIFQKSGDAAIEIKNNVDNVTISGFTVQNSGLRGFTSSRGAIDIDDSSNITISNCEVINNISINGAGLNLDHSNNVSIKNCVFAGNSASNIGSLSFTDARGIVLENVTVADNSGGFRGIGGISVYYSTSDITIKNSIIWNNGNNLDITAGTVNVSYTDFGGGRQGTGNINQDPKFVGSGDYHLQSSSPAIDAGDPSSSYSNEPVPNGGRINMGAYGNTSEATKIMSYSCAWDWPQKIINANTGEILWTCSRISPWCNLGYPQCCVEAAHINCTNMSL